MEPYQEIPLEQAQAFDCSRDVIRAPRETKGSNYRVTETNDGAACCEPDNSCC